MMATHSPYIAERVSPEAIYIGRQESSGSRGSPG